MVASPFEGDRNYFCSTYALSGGAVRSRSSGTASIPPYLVLSKMRVAARIHWRSPISAFTQNEWWHPGPRARPLFTSILNEGRHGGSSGYPPCLVLSNGGVASRIMGPSPLSGSILNERRPPGRSGHPPYLVLSKMRVASWIMGLSPPIWFYPK